MQSGWKTASMSRGYDIVNETDLSDAADAYDNSLDNTIDGERKVRAITEARAKAGRTACCFPPDSMAGSQQHRIPRSRP